MLDSGSVMEGGFMNLRAWMRLGKNKDRFRRSNHDDNGCILTVLVLHS